MDQFSISQLAKYAGIKPHTVRIWEKRYNALTPVRSEGNTRYYDGNQLRRLLNIVSLKDEEANLSAVCELTDEELYKRIRETLDKNLHRGDRTEYFIAQFIASGASYDDIHFNKIFAAVLKQYKMEDAYTKIFYPLINRVGILWSVDKLNAPVEHFLSNMLKQKFYGLINDIPVSKKNTDRWLLFLREGEFHELGLLFASYMIRLSGRRVVYLGADTPLAPLQQSIEIIQPTHLLFFQVAREEPEELDAYITELTKGLKKIPVYVATSLQQSTDRKHVHYLRSLTDLKKQLKQ